MSNRRNGIVFISFLLFPLLPYLQVQGQADIDPPVSPVLDLVSVDPLTGNVYISWLLSPSPDVEGYVIYLFTGNEGYELDTIYSPSATTYTRTGSGSGYYSESFVVAAIDEAGNISPLSNSLGTIFTTAEIDTCNKHIEIEWNSYTPFPREVLSYSILYSVNGSNPAEMSTTGPEITSLVLDDFDVDANYCIIVRANLSGEMVSGSNRTCLTTSMQRPPEWINADYATVGTGDRIELSFTIDPLSEINHFILERKTAPSDNFLQIHSFSDISGSVTYTDNDADIKKINRYRLTAINSCNLPAVSSNIASNIVLGIELKETLITLSWNHYTEWMGSTDSYRLYVKTGDMLEERYSLSPLDSVFVIPYADLMYEAAGDKICFMVKAHEVSNPLTINGESDSQVVCTDVEEKVTVPDIFTPDNNSVNDFFKPVLSFTPRKYRLVITDIKRRIVFETADHDEEWNGTHGGSPLPEGIYLWFLRILTPSGKEISRTGTVTIMFNR